jgi:hypothetical protein
VKKSIYTILFLMMAATGSTQVILEHTYNYSASIVKFESLGYKYYLMDVPGAQCRIYNLDHSLYKTISCNVPAGSYLADIRYLSEKVFDNDEGIELVYTWYTYIPTTDSYYYEYGSSIINEDGSPLTTIDGARYIYLNEAGENSWKLFAYCYDYSEWPERIWTNIYSLPGTPVHSFLPSSELNEADVKAFPNPAGTTVKVAYHLPTEVREATLFLVDNNGKMVRQFLVDNHTDHLLLDVSAYPAGMYYYYLEYGNKRSKSGKLLMHQ